MAADEHTHGDPARGAASLTELLQLRARHQPERLGYRYLVDGETEEQVLTYAGADERARAIGAAIAAAGGGPGSRVLLVLPPGLDYVVSVFGCLRARTVAVPVYPPDPFRLGRSLGRVTAVVRDAEPVVALTIAPLLGYLESLTAQAPELAGLRWVAVDEVPAADVADRDDVVAAPDDLAVLQYTSGSTAQPRGVMLSHRNLLHNSDLIQQIFRTTPDSQGLVWLPPYHDMGLIGGLVQPLYAGCPVTLMSPLHFLEQPLRWLRAISRYRTTASGGPNFAFELCARRAQGEDLSGLDLSTWEVAFNGAEPIRPGALARFGEAFRDTGFRPSAFLPCYGLAEATLIVSGARGLTVVDVDGEALRRNEVRPAADDRATQLVACGTGGIDQQITVVDGDTLEPSDAGRVGEIWVSGPSVAGGYWRNPGETDRVFGARTAAGAGPFLRTGDLGFVHDGGLVVTGRSKDVIIVRGRNHYPQDIEETAEHAHPALRPGCTAAFTLGPDAGTGPDGSEQLVVVLEVRRRHEDVDVEQVVVQVREAVAAEHGLQVRSVVLLSAGGTPKTSSGKVQRWLCRDRLRSGELPVLGRGGPAPEPVAAPEPAPSTIRSLPPGDRAPAVVDWLRERVSELLGTSAVAIDPGRSLTGSGLDSLAVTQLRHRIGTDLGVQCQLRLLLGGRTLTAVAAALDEAMTAPSDVRTEPAAGAVASAFARGEHVVPLSHGQRWMWLVGRVDPTDTRYNLAAALRLPAATDAAALQRALAVLVARHPALRTTFPVRGHEPAQVVHAEASVEVRVRDMGDSTDEALVRRFARSAARPFDLAAGPLLRVELHRGASRDALLLMVHHMVVDFLSLARLARELGELYDDCVHGRAPLADAPTLTYPDVVLAQQLLLADGAAVEPLARYWDDQIRGGVPPLGFSASAPGGTRRIVVPAQLDRRIRETAAREHVTLYMLLLAALQTVLHQRTGLAELVIGASTSGRDHPGYAEVVGCCTNPVPLRSRMGAEEPFRALLARTRDRVIGALEHQDYPMMVLAERHRATLRGRALFEALFTFNRGPDADLAAAATTGLAGTFQLGPLTVETIPLPPGDGVVPIEVVMAETAGGLHGLLRHGPGVLDDAGADALVAHLLDALDAVAADPSVPASALAPRVLAV